MKKTSILAIISLLLVSCGGNSNNENTEIDNQEKLDSIFKSQDIEEVEEDSIEVKPFVLLSESVSDEGNKTQFVVQIPEKYTDMELYIMLDRLKQKCKKTNDFEVSYYLKGSDLEGSPYAIGSVEGQTYNVDLTSKLKAKKTNNNIKRDFVGKWPVGNDMMTIYKYNGKYYLEYQVKGEFTGERFELVRNKNVYKFKNYNDGNETYEIVEGGMYAIEENGAKAFYPSAK